jgi:hypothetical protein
MFVLPAFQVAAGPFLVLLEGLVPAFLHGLPSPVSRPPLYIFILLFTYFLLFSCTSAVAAIDVAAEFLAS